MYLRRIILAFLFRFRLGGLLFILRAEARFLDDVGLGGIEDIGLVLRQLGCAERAVGVEVESLHQLGIALVAQGIGVA
ncbi:hypothetical protein D3C87_1515060 [compost metagenome]